MLTNFKSFLSKPADISVITTYRIFFGFCLLLHAYRYTPIEKITKDFVVPKFFFSFSIFQWLHLPILNAAGFNLLFTFMGISAFCVMVGLFYRYSLSILLITQIYYALLEKSYFPDPNYLYILITFLMFFIDANSQCSVDVILTPRIKKNHVPNLHLWMLRLQFFIVFFYSGISKLFHPDWLHAKQMSIWLKQLIATPLIGNIFTLPWISYFFSYGGIIFDLSIGFLLICKRTRVFAIFWSILFHLFNKQMLNLDLVPWFMLSSIVLFLEPDTPRKFYHNICLKIFPKKNFYIPDKPKFQNISSSMIVFFMIYAAIQLIIPLRPYLYPGVSSWNRDGKRFSWHLMNDNYLGKIIVYYTPPKNKSCLLLQPFNGWQAWMMSGDPGMIQQYVQYLNNQLIHCGINNPKIFIDAKVALNGRDYFPLIDPNVNLAGKTYSFWKKANWIKPHPDRQNLSVEKLIQHKELAQYKVNFRKIAISFNKNVE